MEYKRNRHKFWRHLLSSPIIYMQIIPFVIMDVFMEIYHRLCFPLYGIEYVQRGKYIKWDRHKLKYLPWYDKINCAYCGYANGVVRYVAEIDARTEKYWCAIKHDPNEEFIEPEHHKEFIPYGDEETFNKIHKGSDKRNL